MFQALPYCRRDGYAGHNQGPQGTWSREQ
jgi:hypothetical protein